MKLKFWKKDIEDQPEWCPIEIPDIAYWNTDVFLAGVIRDAVRQQREYGNGIPGSIMFDDHDKQRSNEEGRKIWDSILLDIEAGFDDYVQNKYTMKFDKEKFAYSFNLLQIYFGSLWD